MKTSLFFKSLIKSCLALLITSPAWAQCTAVIYPTPTSTCSAITFSAGNFNGTYEWDFGDGSTATYTSNASVYHYYYPSSGSHYKVTLNLYSPTNTVTPCSTTTETVSVNCTYTNSCQATFTVNNTASCYGFKFINNSSLPGANAYYVWDFGDGNSTTAYSNNALNHTYASTGAYVASLSVYTSTASTTPCSVFTQTVAVTCATCQSVYSTQTSTASCNLVYFNNQSTGGATYYVYDFGDGYTTTAYNTNVVQHIYPSSNTTYTTSLTVYNSSSTSPCSISYQPVTISCGTTTPCAASFNTSIYASNCNMILFNNTSYYPDPNAYSKWEFGDGNSTTVSPTYSNGSVVYNYLTNGVYTATLSIYSSTASTTPCSSTTRTLSVCGPTCTAAFSAVNNYTTSCNTYTYTNTSTAGPGAYYKWQFGDGAVTNMGSTASVLHTYTANGVYTTTLGVYSSTASTTPCSTAYQTVTVSCPTSTCQAAFSAVNNYTVSCNTYTYTNTSTAGPGAYYKWQFGDGAVTNMGSTASVLHTYTANGVYTTTLGVYSSTASTTPCSKAYQTLTVSCITTTCQAAFTAVTNYTSSTCNTYTYTNTSTAGPGAYYKWQFGDGGTTNTGSTATIYHTYTANGVYTNTLGVYTSTASTTPCSTAYQTVTVSCITPTCQAAFSAVNNYTASCNTYTYTNTSTAGPGAYYEWQFGDGALTNTGSTANVFHTYSTNGVYTTTLSVYSSTASMTPCSTAYQTVTVSCPTSTCQAAFSAVNNYTASCNTYTYTNTSTAGPGAYYKWQFGDGAVTNMGSTASVLHTYTANGVYTNTLGVYTSTASTTPCSTAYQTVTVSCITPTCQAAFTAVNNYTASCNTYTYTNTSTAGPGAYYEWQFGDGALTNTGSTANVFHTYSTNGVYTTTLSVYSSTASMTPCSTAYQTVTVSCPTSTCQAAFSAVNNYTVSCNTYTYTNTSTAGPGAYYKWQFGDGAVTNMGSTASVLHTYTANGVYTTTLGVYSSTASTTPCSKAYQTMTVSCITTTCQANSQFTLFADTANPGNYFAYNSSTGSGTLSYLWNFGDGNTSTQQYPFHQYATPGQYVVCLKVTSTTGTTSCTATYCDSSSVRRVASGFFMTSITGVPQAPTGLAENSLIRSMTAYPNPMRDELIIALDLYVATEMHYEITNSLGQMTLKDSITGSRTTVNTSGLDQGFYFLSLKDGNGKVLKTVKLVK